MALFPKKVRHFSANTNIEQKLNQSLILGVAFPKQDMQARTPKNDYVVNSIIVNLNQMTRYSFKSQQMHVAAISRARVLF